MVKRKRLLQRRDPSQHDVHQIELGQAIKDPSQCGGIPHVCDHVVDVRLRNIADWCGELEVTVKGLVGTDP